MKSGLYLMKSEANLVKLVADDRSKRTPANSADVDPRLMAFGTGLGVVY